MRRREFISLLGGAATVWPLASRAQQRERVPLGLVMGEGTCNEKGDVDVRKLTETLRGRVPSGRRRHARDTKLVRGRRELRS